MATAVEGKHDEEADVDLTPIIDLVFNLIIFFMVISDLTTLNFADIVLPKADAATPTGETERTEDESMIVNVTEDGTIVIGGDDIHRDQLVEWMRNYVEAHTGQQVNPEQPEPVESLQILIRADKEANFEYVHHVFDACQQAGIYKMRVAAIKEESEILGE